MWLMMRNVISVIGASESYLLVLRNGAVIRTQNNHGLTFLKLNPKISNDKCWNKNWGHK